MQLKRKPTRKGGPLQNAVLEPAFACWTPRPQAPAASQLIWGRSKSWPDLTRASYSVGLRWVTVDK